MSEKQPVPMSDPAEAQLDRQEAWIVDATEVLYGDRTEVAERFVEHLVTTGIEWGLLGPREIPRMWDRHVLNCAAVQELLPRGAVVADVGSGAGLPGLALAIARPDVQFVLIEPLERRVDWLDMVVEDLGLDNVDVIRARSEQVFDTVDVDIVTARAVSAMKSLVPITVPLLHGQGELLAIKGQSAAAEIEKAEKVLRKFKTKKSEVLTVGEELLEVPTTVARLTYGS
ncbi:16S rRNA (guanine527-N7)-methyltransferase [Enteractinococcus coprophilus]|uniref:Ribosomal RNA small subunit methyltransferase G n=3 Tax=Micrococcales TaxID=85006 RepID=A0A543ANU2_9MICC|nr:16S rRNA (guanine527-N7)-methyltransferase [Enteractinococcus coprophilus]